MSPCKVSDLAARGVRKAAIVAMMRLHIGDTSARCQGDRCPIYRAWVRLGRPSILIRQRGRYIAG